MEGISIHYHHNKQEKNKDLLLTVSKFCYFLLLIYMGWFQWVFYSLPYVSLAIGSCMLVFIIYHCLIYKKSIFQALNFEISAWIIFSITSLASGILVAVNMEFLTDSIITFIEFLLVIYTMIFISLQEKSIDYFINSFIVYSLVCSFTTIFFGTYVYFGRMSMSATTNPNMLAMVMVIGVFCILYLVDFKKTITTLFQLSVLFLFLYVIIMTGSRKHLFSALILLIFWILFVRNDVFKQLRKNKFVKKIVYVLGLATLSIFFINMVFGSEILFRIRELFQDGDSTRLYMYKVAFDLFAESPIVGIGLNNFRAVTYFQTHSHSTYAEILVSTGVLGMILYFIPYVTIFLKAIRLWESQSEVIKKNSKMIIGLFLVLLFLGTGIIHIYDLSSSIAFGLILAFISLYYRKTF